MIFTVIFSEIPREFFMSIAVIGILMILITVLVAKEVREYGLILFGIILVIMGILLTVYKWYYDRSRNSKKHKK